MTALVAALALPTAARAQVLGPPELSLTPNKEDPKVSKAHDIFAQTDAIVADGRYEEALARYREAYLTYADPRLLSSMGHMAQLLLDHLVEADQYYSAFEDAVMHIQATLRTELEAKTTTKERRAQLERTLKGAAKKLDIVRGGRDAVRQELAKEYAQVQLDVLPTDAIVTFDGERYPTVIVGVRTLWVPPGSHEVKVIAPGHRTETRWLTLRRSSPYDLRVRLERSEVPHTGGVRVSSGASPSFVTIDGNDATSALVSPFMLAPGSYEVVVSSPGHEDFTQTIEVRPGKVADVVAVLEPSPDVAALIQPESQLGVEWLPDEPGPAWTRADTAWTLVGAGGALLVSGIAMHAVSVSQANEINGRDVSCPGCLGRAREDYGSAKDLYSGALVSYSASAAALVSGAVLLIIDVTEEDPLTPSLGAAPIEGGGFVEGTWRF